MKRKERHHLKENELQRFAIQTRDLFETRRREMSNLLIGVIVLVVAAAGYFLWNEHVQARAHSLLADALTAQESRVAIAGTPPTPGTYPTDRARLEAAAAKFKAVADGYPSTDAGIFARYQEAADQLALGNTTAAVAGYQEVLRRGGDLIYGQVARLGLAAAQARSGQYEQAINAFKELAQRKDGPLPIDGILMELGRTYRSAGKAPEAKQTFNRLVEEYPDSPYMQEAKRELDNLNKAA
jgi:TolA-binding protein